METNNWNLRSCHTLNFFWQLCSHGNFQRAFNSLESKNIPMIFWLSSAMVNGFHQLQCRGKSVQRKITARFPKPLKDQLESRLWGGLPSLLVSNEKKSYPAVSVKMILPPFLCVFPTRRKKPVENHVGCWLDPEVLSGWQERGTRRGQGNSWARESRF